MSQRKTNDWVSLLPRIMFNLNSTRSSGNNKQIDSHSLTPFLIPLILYINQLSIHLMKFFSHNSQTWGMINISLN